MFVKGETITVTSLKKIFRNLFHKVNEVTSLNVKALTTAQILDVAQIRDIAQQSQYNLVVRPMSVSTEQYFDTTYVLPYSVGFDNDMPSGDWSFMKFYLNEIDKLEEIHGR